MRPGLATCVAGFEAVSTVVLLAAVLWRLPSVLRRPQERLLWGTMALTAVAMAMDQPPIARLLSDGPATLCSVALARNMIGVLSACGVLYFVAASGGNRRFKRAVLFAVPFVLAGLVLIAYGVKPPCAEAVPGITGAPRTAGYWVLLGSTHLIADSACAVMCRRYACRSMDRSLRVSLALFGWGAVCAGVFWAGRLVGLITPLGDVVLYLRIALGLHAVLRAAALLVRDLAAVGRAASDARAIWRLWPLWRSLVAAVPHVALKRYRWRGTELLCAPSHWRYLVYRKVIETRDAILVLQDYAHPAALRRARDHVAAAGLPARAARPAVLACVIREACAAKRANLREGGGQESADIEVDRGELAAEIDFLLEVAEAYTSACVKSFVKSAEKPSGRPPPEEPAGKPPGEPSDGPGDSLADKSGDPSSCKPRRARPERQLFGRQPRSKALRSPSR
ncbi:MAB_1171c family putative transporter [Streptomyces sp. NPDC057654]|uniref:MAB_1171c family putative transporter n=1 Tax=Streptomyces sp. NPDC057654 TaxID=3346196 RepID=UPI0036B4795B